MAELKMISPLLSNMELVKCLSDRGGTAVYITKSTKTHQQYILKHISVPESQRQVDALIYTGAAADEEAAQKYYAEVVADYQAELELLEKLSDSPNLDCYRSYQIAPKDGEVGYDVYLLAEYRSTLLDFWTETPMTHLTAVNLGLDLCNALGDLRDAGLMHRDVKPSNIYRTAQGHFTLGDLGVAKVDELKYCSMPEHMLSTYSAPELFSLVGTLEPTADLYSVGLILYRIFNGNHGPFEDENTSAKAADKRRVTGEELPAPMYADYELAEIILKACAFAPAGRYQTPEELKNALMDYVKRNDIQDERIVPPIVADPEPIDVQEAEEEVEPVQFADAETLPEDFVESFSPDNDLLNSIIESVHRDFAQEDLKQPMRGSLEPEEEEPEEGEEEDFVPPVRKKRRKKVWPLVLAMVLVIALAAAAVYYFYTGPSTVKVEQMTLVQRTSSAVVVTVQSPEKDGAFEVSCSDAYGNVSIQPYVKGGEIVFAELAAGTQYAISVKPLEGQKVDGNGTLMVSTMSETTILSFTATPVSVTQAELNITMNGPDPGIWTVRYYAADVPEEEVTFTGHNTTVANLKSNTEYTFYLVQPEGTFLTGPLETTFSTVPSVDIGALTAKVSSSTAILSWTFEGDAPESWTVSINGPDGYSATQTVTEPTVTFEGLTSGTDYEVIISAPTMLQDGKATISPTVTTLNEFSCDFDEEKAAYVLNWACEVDPAENNWVLSYGPAGMEPKTMSVEDANTASIPAEGLVPDAQYSVTLIPASGEKLVGVSDTTTFRTAKTEKFKSYGFDKGYIGLYLKPEGDDWGITQLVSGRTEYKVGEAMAYAIESINTLQDSGDRVSVLLVIRDENGEVVAASEDHRIWNEMWEGKLTYGAFPNALAQAGKMNFEVYINHQLVIAQPFTVTE